MSRDAAWWMLALAGSAAMHAVLIELVLLAVAPGDVPPASRPEVRLSIVARRVDRSEARAAETGGEVVAGARAEGNPVSQRTVPASRAGAVLPPAAELRPGDVDAALVPGVKPAAPVAAALPSAQGVAAAAPAAPRLSAGNPARASSGADETTPLALPAVERPPVADVVQPVPGRFAPVPEGSFERRAAAAVLPPAADLTPADVDAGDAAVAAALPSAQRVAAAAPAAPRLSAGNPAPASSGADETIPVALPAPERPPAADVVRPVPGSPPEGLVAGALEAAARSAPDAVLPAAKVAAVDAAGAQAAAIDGGARRVDVAAVPSQQVGPRSPAPDRALQAAEWPGEATRAETLVVAAASATISAAVPEAARARQTESSDTALTLPAEGMPLAVREPLPEAVLPPAQVVAAASQQAAEVAPDHLPAPAGTRASETPAREGEPDAERVEAAETSAPTAAGVRADAAAMPAAPLEETALAAATAAAMRPASVSPPGRRLVAALAWTGGADAEVDPVSLSTIESFMPTGGGRDGGGGEVRDALSQLLAAVPCARLQSTFVPETGRLVLHGHIPEEAMRAPVLAALRGQIGGAIPVADRMLILPRPQCATLAAMASSGLPQSTDQSPSPRVVGAEAYARVYDFAEGDRLLFSVTGPDYDAYIYADYYDADGMVIHLQPNAQVPQRRLAAAAPLEIGGGEDGLELRVSPPFGQEIVVVMATSAPLHGALRPVREPAPDYLAFLREQVRQARARASGFKGEWVYFFVRTSAG